ncbi:chromosome segregation protein SMC [Caproiciproducens sp. NJN-50]|uniref:chromosome segregation protein SMC n=1 Tax=Acutalibacteraceae TaxID=3082771 RepID=UPI000FFDFDB6|nr:MULTISPECIES: chromosome segregation protein SMC [Acutalibacteraceae]QAT49768.1 chromosome segregation protein SMC [Caproiciproducens sp. NJN-50]
MLLKSLELQGFKTFPDRTTLTFHDGITAVVGPNGSGKSNISDAVRWVLGEQSVRSLRCTKMEDVIFGGTPARKALGFAEVTLNIDNTGRQLPFESDGVAVTRRYYRSGESEYLINKTNVRLKDVNELFMDTGLGRDGYSMIGQGRIDAIVAARSEDRREIFEEAAGISRFRYRREESERRLSQAEDNLLRLNDILAELESRVGPLGEQAEKAKEYLKLSEEKRKAEISLWLRTLNQSALILREQEDKILAAKSQHDAAEQSILSLDEELEKIFSRSNQFSASIDETRRLGTELQESAAQKDAEASVLKNDILHNRENIERIQTEMEQSRLSGEELLRMIQDKEKQIEEKNGYVKKRDADFADCSARLEQLKGSLSETAGRMDGFTREMTELSSQATDFRMLEMTASASIAEIRLRLNEIHKNAEEIRLKHESLKEKEKEYLQKLENYDRRIEALGNTVQGHEMRLKTRRDRLEASRRQSDGLRLDLEDHLRRARLLEDLERNLEGFSQSVKAVMKEASRGALNGVHGPVSRLIRVPKEYAVAVETALGASMQNIVVGTEQDAKRAIGFLKDRNSGRATFLPLSVIKGRVLAEPGLSGCPGFVGVASGLCSCDPRYQEILKSLLGRIAVAENLDFAVQIAGKYGYRFRVVTLDGQVVNAGGSLTGGSLAKNSGLLSRASEIEALKKQAEELRVKADAAAQTLKAAAQEVSSEEAGLSASKGELATVQEERVHADAEHRRILADLQTAEKSAISLKQEEATANARLEEQGKAVRNAQTESERLNGQIEALKTELEKAGGSRDEISTELDRLTADLKQIELDRLSARKDAQSLRDTVGDLEKRSLGQKEKLGVLADQIKEIETSNAELNARIERLGQEAGELRNQSKEAAEKADGLNRERMELEKKSVELRASEREKSEEKEKIGHELARLEERRNNLQKEYDEIISRLWEEYELTRREAEQEAEPAQDPKEAQRRLSELKSRIKSLGTVNLSAVEEYKEVSERYEFMKAQIADVEQSRDELKKLIGDLTGRMRDLFSVRFEQINRCFSETFRDLFEGGEAGLSLSEPDDVLGSGIEISVQPPGKIVSHLEALSGGEKALVAIALYFAIMKVNPPPFCVLDEIEAALDDVNVNRFAAYLRRMTENTQFIVITHRRGSMEEADVLYGVTMQEEGVSKMLEMPASELEIKMGIKP